MTVRGLLGLEPIEARPTVLQLHTLAQPRESRRRGVRTHANEVLALHLG